MVMDGLLFLLSCIVQIGLTPPLGNLYCPPYLSGEATGGPVPKVSTILPWCQIPVPKGWLAEFCWKSIEARHGQMMLEIPCFLSQLLLWGQGLLVQLTPREIFNWMTASPCMTCFKQGPDLAVSELYVPNQWVHMTQNLVTQLTLCWLSLLGAACFLLCFACVFLGNIQQMEDLGPRTMQCVLCMRIIIPGSGCWHWWESSGGTGYIRVWHLTCEHSWTALKSICSGYWTCIKAASCTSLPAGWEQAIVSLQLVLADMHAFLVLHKTLVFLICSVHAWVAFGVKSVLLYSSAWPYTSNTEQFYTSYCLATFPLQSRAVLGLAGWWLISSRVMSKDSMWSDDLLFSVCLHLEISFQILFLLLAMQQSSHSSQ